MEVRVLGMEGVRRVGETASFPVRMAPYTNRSAKICNAVDDACNNKVTRSPLNGRRLKVNVERLKPSHLSKEPLSGPKKRNRKNSEKSSLFKDYVR